MLALISMLLDIGVAGVIVDGDVQVEVAERRATTPALGRPTPDAMPWGHEGRELCGVEMDQRSWA